MTNKAYLYCLRLLGGQEYSVAKLRTKLKLKDFPEEEREEALQMIVEKGYLNEERYTELKIKSLALKGKSTRLINRALGEEGLKVSEAHIKEVLEEKGISEDEQLRELLRKKLRNHVPGQALDPAQRTKIIRFALSRGHSYANIKKILGLELESTDESPDFF